MILLDTSVWIEVFRHGGLALESVIPFDDIVTCLPVVQEVVQGFRDQRPYRTARDAMLSLPTVESPMTREVFVEAAELYRSARRQGYTIRSSVDCLIASCALRHDLEVIHRDRDFTSLARVSPLRQTTI